MDSSEFENELRVNPYLSLVSKDYKNKVYVWQAFVYLLQLPVVGVGEITYL